MMLRMCYYGNPVLRRKAKPIVTITDEIRQLAQQMVEILQEQRGIGLAAPQVGVSLRLFISTVYPDQANGEATYGEPRIFINPILTHPSKNMCEMNEGCLSIPGLSASVARPESIELEAQDLEGQIWRESLNGFWARVCMHEIDHLNGILYIDRIKGKARTALDSHLRRIKQEFTGS